MKKRPYLRSSIPAATNAFLGVGIALSAAGATLIPAGFLAEPQEFKETLKIGFQVGKAICVGGFGLLGVFNATSIALNYISDREQMINDQKLPLQAAASRKPRNPLHPMQGRNKPRPGY